MTPSALRFEVDDLTRGVVLDLLRFHVAQAHANSPAEAVHAFDVARLRGPEIRFRTVWDGETLIGMGALKTLDAAHGEIKSMRVVDGRQGQGIGRAILEHLLDAAREAGMARVSLETGGNDAFASARAMYERAGFVPVDGFAGYRSGPFTRCYARRL